jgi:hypothetical protein
MPAYTSWQLAGLPLYLLLGLPVIALNCWAITCIKRAKILTKNRFFYLIIVLAASDITVAVNYMAYAVYRSLLYYGQLSIAVPSAACYTFNLLFTIGDNAQELAMLAIAIERIYAVGWPIQYRTNGGVAVSAMIGVVVVTSGSIGLIGYAAFFGAVDPATMLAPCLQTLAGAAGFWVFWTQFRNGVFVLTLAVYVAIPFVARRATRKYLSQTYLWPVLHRRDACCLGYDIASKDLL